jgi:hypothetical protein
MKRIVKIIEINLLDVVSQRYLRNCPQNWFFVQIGQL